MPASAHAESVEQLKAAEMSESGAISSIDEDGDIIEPINAPDVKISASDIAGDGISENVVPRQENEFTCSVCYLVQRKACIDHVEDDGMVVCRDCA